MKRIIGLILLASSVMAFGQNGHWRGPAQNGHFPGEGLPESWSEAGENLLWDAPYGARSAPVVFGDRVYLINRAGEGGTLQERLMALDLNTGKLLWEHRFNAFLTDIVSVRLGWANICVDPENGNVYGHGVQGLFFCISPEGKVLWHRSLTEEIGRISGYGGRTNTPIIDGPNVILSSLTSSWGPHGRGLHRFWAMDKKTGAIQWMSAPSGKPLDTTYATPVIHDHKGVRTLFTGLADGAVTSMDPVTGAKNWSTVISKRGINSSIIYGCGLIFASHSEENISEARLGALVALDPDSGAEKWRISGLTAGYASPALDEAARLLYVSDNSANLRCIDVDTGKELWEFNYGKEAKGSPTLADGKIYVCEVRGAISILKVSREGCTSLSKVSLVKPSGAPADCFGTPTVAHGKVFIPSVDHLYCLSTKPAAFRDAKPSPAKLVSAPAGEIVHIQLEPAEAWIAPGGSQTYTVAAFDAQGNRKEIPAAALALKGLDGEVKDLSFTASPKAIFQAGTVTATVGDKTSTVRLRVIPQLPIKEDFNSRPLDLPPPGWITSKIKAKVIDHEGEKVLLKLADRPAPPFARLRCYITPPLQAAYTIQSDVFGLPKKRGRREYLPDMGLINSRYILHTIGSPQKLRLTTWAAIPRVQKDIDFKWDANTWYTMKLSVEIMENIAHIKGKIWKRGEKEPAAWTIEMEDATPNTEGSPGLYAYSRSITSASKGTEVLFDNVSITPNK
jgi:outer membrane protein assembly factor BamB